MVSFLDGVECIDIGPLKLNVFFYPLQVKQFPRLSLIILVVEEILNHK